MTGLRDDSLALREAVIATARAMNARGINVNKSGNVSVRCARGPRAGFLLTPTGVPYDALEPDDIAFVGADGRATGRCAPSSEWRFHADDLRGAAGAARGRAHALRPSRPRSHAWAAAIPAFHYMVAVAGGDDIRCADYATFGTQALADHALAALRGPARRACWRTTASSPAVPRSTPRWRSPWRSRTWRGRT